MVKEVTKRFQKRKDIKGLVNGLDGAAPSIMCQWYQRLTGTLFVYIL